MVGFWGEGFKLVGYRAWGFRETLGIGASVSESGLASENVKIELCRGL